MNTAQNAGINADENTVKNTDERIKLLEEPQIKSMMDQDKRIKENNNSKAASAGINSKDKGTSGGSDQDTHTNGNLKNNLRSQSSGHGTSSDLPPGKSKSKPADSFQGKSQRDQEAEKDNAAGNHERSGSKENWENQRAKGQ